MKVLDILNAPWAIHPEKYIQIREIYLRHVAGEKIDLAAIEAQLGRPLQNEPQPYVLTESGIAIVSIEGVLAKRMDLFMQISGGTSTRTVGRNLAAAAADSATQSILLWIDSPGGEVDGTQDLARRIFGLRKQGMPIVALADGMAASAAYWLAAAAEKIFVLDQTTQIGSIGVIATHTDISKAQEMRGVTTTLITAGKYKAVGSPYGPLSRDAEDTIREKVTQVYSVFVDDVARFRGVSVEKVLSDMADGRVFLGDKAVAAGLADGMMTDVEVQNFLQQRAAARRLNQERNRVAKAVLDQFITGRLRWKQ